MSDHPQHQKLAEFDSLDEQSRRALLRHVRECAACRARWAAEDPSRLFAALALAPPDDDALERLSAAVDRGIELETTRRKRGRIYAVASIAASLMLAAVVGSFLLNDDVAPPPDAARVPPIAALSAEAPGAPPEAEWSGVYLVASPGEARVVDLTIGETRVVMIFDEAFDL